MATAHIAHDCHIETMSLCKWRCLAGHVTVKFAVIGGLAAVHQFIHIGDHAMISGGSLVKRSFLHLQKAAKEPLSYVGLIL
jgi:UDP-N-acetylglucosamine acyltransferase